MPCEQRRAGGLLGGRIRELSFEGWGGFRPAEIQEGIAGEVVLNLACSLRSLGELGIGMPGSSPNPEILTQLFWGRAWASGFVKAPRMILRVAQVEKQWAIEVSGTAQEQSVDGRTL